MPLVGINSYIIDFSVLPTNDPKKIILLDQSTYIATPKLPLIEVTLPGFTGAVQIPYTPNSIITLNSDSLGLTEPCDYDYLADLPDGVYQITMMICPYTDLYNKQCYLKCTNLQNQFRDLLLNLDINCKCLDEKKLEEEMVHIDILIQSAIAESSVCNLQKATAKYISAYNAVQRLTKKLNCK